MTHYKTRDDAIWHAGRRIVPTVWGQREGNTKWVSDWNEFRAAGGVSNFNEDHTEIILTLPTGYKFSIQFQNKTEGVK